MREPIAQRTLALHAADTTSDVLIRMWAPVPRDTDFICDVAIDGLAQPIRDSILGVDSLQALILALQAVYWHLEPVRDALSHWDERGRTGVPYMVSHFLAAEERRLERFVRDETDRSAAAFVANHAATQRNERNRERYDPDGANVDYRLFTSGELAAELRSAAARAYAFKRAGNTDGWAVFYQKQTAAFSALLERPEREALLRELAAPGPEAERPLRYRAAEILTFEFARTGELERLAAEGVEPEAGQARTLLERRAREAARPKPWDTDTIDP